MDKYRVSLTAEERAELEHMVSVGKAAARKLTHARILLLADTTPGGERSDEQIVAALGVGVCTIARVRKRLVTEGLQQALTPRPQPLRPDKVKITGDMRILIKHAELVNVLYDVYAREVETTWPRGKPVEVGGASSPAAR